ncbi:MAG: hypothetical protein J6Z27_04955 [Bacteroidales bacterium]|nr:hypothetical protein [Bacteroidales bacterium]
MTLYSQENINIRYSETDFDKSLKLSSLLNLFQDIATDNAERLGFGYSDIHPKNLMWVLLKYRIEFAEYPVDAHQLTLRTEPRGYNKLFTYRNFCLKTGDRILAKASTLWALVDFTTMTMVNIENALDNPNMRPFEPGEDDLSFGRILPVKSVDFEETFKVRYNDIDGNMHANNANYAIWALEPLSYDFRKSHRPKTVDMIYKKETRYGESLSSQVQMLDDTTSLHLLKNLTTGEDSFMMKVEWK